MSNPKFVLGPISKAPREKLEKFTLVTLNDDDTVSPATAAGPVFGAVTEGADPNNKAAAQTAAVHVIGAPKLRVAGGDAEAILPGAPVYAADNGEVSASGSVQIGVAVDPGKGDRVTVLLSVPTAGDTDPLAP